MLNGRISTGTRGPTNAEKQAPPHEQLKWISFLPQLVPLAHSKLEANRTYQQLATRNLYWDDADDLDVFHSLHPDHTGQGLPPEIRSEQDTTSYLNAKLVFPAINFIRLLQETAGTARGRTAYISSCNGTRGQGTPDAILFDRLRKLILGVLEWKTANAMPASLLEEFVTQLASMQGENKVPVRFWMDQLGSESTESLVKILSQVLFPSVDYSKVAYMPRLIGLVADAV